MKKLIFILAIFATACSAEQTTAAEDETNTTVQEITNQDVDVSWITDILINTFTK